MSVKGPAAQKKSAKLFVVSWNFIMGPVVRTMSTAPDVSFGVDNTGDYH